jgi:hypothetical protein
MTIHLQKTLLQNEVEVLDPVVDDTQLQQQFYEDD